MYEDRAGNIWFSSYENKIILADMSVFPTRPMSIASQPALVFKYYGWRDRRKRSISRVGSPLAPVRDGPGTAYLQSRHQTDIGLSLPASSSTNLDTARITAFWWESTDRLWIATRSNGLYLWDRAGKSLVEYRRQPARRRDPGMRESRTSSSTTAVVCGSPRRQRLISSTQCQASTRSIC